MKKFFPHLQAKVEALSDNRQINKCDYTSESLFWMSILLMLTPTSSRRQYNEDFNTPEIIANFAQLFGIELDKIPHGDTLNNYWLHLEVDELEELKQSMLRTLIKSKTLDPFRFFGSWLIAIDGVELYRFSQRHCDNCLHSTHNGVTTYYHRVLEAKLVCSNGLVFSIASEFIDNEGQKPDDKQDCEHIAFHRLAKRLKQAFKRLPITLLADGLYPNGPVFARCEKYDWKYIFVLQESVLKTVWEDFWGLCQMPPNALGVLEKPNQYEKEGYSYLWQNELDYQGKDFTGKINLLAKQKDGEVKRAFVSNWGLIEKNIFQIEEVGQCRWKIENEGFNVQKNHGYGLEHTYSKDFKGMQVVYHLIQIAHSLMQMCQKADLLGISNQIKSLRKWHVTLRDALLSDWSSARSELWNAVMKREIRVRWSG